MRPIPIELIQDTSLLISLIPVFASALVAGAAVYSVIRSTRIAIQTNREAIAASNDREFEKWQREAILRTSTAVGQYALHAENDYMRFAFLPDPASVSPMEAGSTLAEHAVRIGTATLELRLLGAHTTAQKCADLRSVLNSDELVGSLAEVMSARIQLSPHPPGRKPERLAAAEKEFRAEYGRIEPARQDFTATAEQELASIGRK